MKDKQGVGPQFYTVKQSHRGIDNIRTEISWSDSENCIPVTLNSQRVFCKEKAKLITAFRVEIKEKGTDLLAGHWVEFWGLKNLRTEVLGTLHPTSIKDGQEFKEYSDK